MTTYRSVLRITLLLIATPMVMLPYQNCGRFESSLIDLAAKDAADFQTSKAESIAAFAETLQPLIQVRCAACHGVSQEPMFAVEDTELSHDTLLNNFLVDLQTPENSRLVLKILEGHNGFAASWADEVEQVIFEWSDILASASPDLPPDDGSDTPDTVEEDPPPVVNPPPPPITNKATYSWVSANVLNSRCVVCHGPSGARRGIRYDSYNRAMSTVVPGSPNDSYLYTSIESGNMPQGGLTVTADELKAIYDWIASGAPNN